VYTPGGVSDVQNEERVFLDVCGVSGCTGVAFRTECVYSRQNFVVFQGSVGVFQAECRCVTVGLRCAPLVSVCSSGVPVCSGLSVDVFQSDCGVLHW
jgi:hypothetical protein